MPDIFDITAQSANSAISAQILEFAQFAQFAEIASYKGENGKVKGEMNLSVATRQLRYEQGSRKEGGRNNIVITF